MRQKERDTSAERILKNLPTKSHPCLMDSMLALSRSSLTINFLQRNFIQMNTNPLTAELLRSLFNYDPRSGVITYAANRGPRLAGQPAGSTQRGLPCIYVAGKHHRACLIAWILAYGVDPSPKYVIHTDRIPLICQSPILSCLISRLPIALLAASNEGRRAGKGRKLNFSGIARSGG